MGQWSRIVLLAEKTKRRLMMLPLLPEEAITSEVVDLIIATWKKEAPERLKSAFDRLANTIRDTYIRAPRTGRQPTGLRFPPHLWSVCGRSVRTNNGAESFHSTINPKSKGKLSIHRFLAIIEKAMAKARDIIATGCEPEARSGVPRRTLSSRSSSTNFWEGGKEPSHSSTTADQLFP